MLCRSARKAIITFTRLGPRGLPPWPLLQMFTTLHCKKGSNLEGSFRRSKGGYLREEDRGALCNEQEVGKHCICRLKVIP